MSRILVAIVATLAVGVLSLWVLNSRLSDDLTTATIENASLRMTIARSNEALNGYREAHTRDTASLVVLDKKIIELEDYVSSLPDGDARCLSTDDTERLRQLWP
jgi:hypothetical protein